jgi:hypothetical protein
MLANQAKYSGIAVEDVGKRFSRRSTEVERAGVPAPERFMRWRQIFPLRD